MIRYNGVNPLAMATGDMDGTIRFWRDLPGFRLVAGLGAPGSRRYFFGISSQDLLAFFDLPGVKARAMDGTTKEFQLLVRIDTHNELDYFRHGGILPYVLRQALK